MCAIRDTMDSAFKPMIDKLNQTSESLRTSMVSSANCESYLSECIAQLDSCSVSLKKSAEVLEESMNRPERVGQVA